MQNADDIRLMLLYEGMWSVVRWRGGFSLHDGRFTPRPTSPSSLQLSIPSTLSASSAVKTSVAAEPRWVIRG
jgi:hypothetical protein